MLLGGQDREGHEGPPNAEGPLTDRTVLPPADDEEGE